MRTSRLSFMGMAVFTVLLAAGASFAAIITVEQDGSGDFTTIIAAAASASFGDTISVGPGVYDGPVEMAIPLTIVSTGGPDVTTVDGHGAARHFLFTAGQGGVIQGFTLVNGYDPSGGASIRVQNGATIDVYDCRFSNNLSDYSAGCVFSRDTGSRIDVFDCVFTGNHGSQHGGAGVSILSSKLTFTNCVFTNNTSDVFAGAIAAVNAGLDITGCVFAQNASGDVAGAVYYYNGTGTVTGSTFFANDSPGVVSGTVTVQASPAVSIVRNIIAEDPSGAGVRYYDCVPGLHSCNVYWDNQDGAIIGGALSADEVVADPVFCGAPSGDFTISVTSPAAPANSPCGLLVGALPTGCDIVPEPSEPVITSVRDVPNDQGRQVRIKWQRCVWDAPNSDYVITGYAIYRFQGAYAAAGPALVPPAGEPRGEGAVLDGWDYVITVPARGDLSYQTVVPTLCDSTSQGICWSVFFVSAMTPSPVVYFDSAPDSGYSVDNIPPLVPQNFSVAYLESGNVLAWDPSDDTDLDHYRVYRSDGPSQKVLVHATRETGWVDDATGTTHASYFLAAVDRAGNESDYAVPDIGTGSEQSIPQTFALYQNVPNPFNPATEIRYDVPSNGRVTLEIYDVSGRMVRRLVDDVQSPGPKFVTWKGDDDRGHRVATGVYFYRLTAPGFQRTLKMTLVE
jgi:hypothetical protein